MTRRPAVDDQRMEGRSSIDDLERRIRNGGKDECRAQVGVSSFVLVQVDF